MDRMLLNQKTVNERKEIKKIQKDSNRTYCRGKSVSKTKIGKLVHLLPSGITADEIKSLPAEANLDRLLELLRLNNLTGMSGNGFPVTMKI